MVVPSIVGRPWAPVVGSLTCDRVRVQVMFDRIVVPTDGSEYAEAAAEDAIALAIAHDATLHVVSVADTGPFGGVRLPGEAESADEAIRGRAETFVEQIVARAAEGGVDATAEILSGPPGSEILEHAEAVDADLIVMGSRGRGGIHRMAVGSVADHVIRFGDVRVLVVTDADDGTD